MSREAAAIVMEEISKTPQLLLCAATGNSPLHLYRELEAHAAKNAAVFDQLRLIPLDEWVGLASPEGSCERYLQEHLIQPLNISRDRYFGFNAKAKILSAECLRIQNVLQKQGPIDLCILGLGKNGHLGFNEPANKLQSHCHLARLSPQSQTHGMISSAKEKPRFGITLGMEDILNAKRILLLVSGEGKEVAKAQLLTGKMLPQWPATMLWQHSNIDCLLLE